MAMGTDGCSDSLLNRRTFRCSRRRQKDLFPKMFPATNSYPRLSGALAPAESHRQGPPCQALGKSDGLYAKCAAECFAGSRNDHFVQLSWFRSISKRKRAKLMKAYSKAI